MMRTISVAVVDDHPLLRAGVVRSLEETGGFKVVAEGSSRDDAERIATELKPDILLLDLSMPGNGHDALRRVKVADPSRRVVVLTVSELGDDVTAALDAGASGYVLKGIGSRELAEVLTAVAAGETYVAPTLSGRLLSTLCSSNGKPSVAALTEREREVLQLVAEGLSNKQIGLSLKLQEKTVKHHMSSVLAKLNAHNRTEAAMIFASWGWGR